MVFPQSKFKSMVKTGSPIGGNVVEDINQSSDEVVRQFAEINKVELDIEGELGTFSAMDEVNMNSGYLLMILRFLAEYEEIRLKGIHGVGKQNPDWYNAQYDLLAAIYDWIYCKMVDRYKDMLVEIEKKLNYCEDNLHRICIQTSDGGMLLNRDVSRSVQNTFRSLVRDYLYFMEKKGMLTKKFLDPKYAMSKFTD